MVSKIKSNYKTSKLAEEDLLAIFLHGIENYGVKKAQQYSAEIDRTFNLLADYPGMGKTREELFPGALSFSVGSHIIFTEKLRSKLKLPEFYIGEWIMNSIFFKKS